MKSMTSEVTHRVPRFGVLAWAVAGILLLAIGAFGSVTFLDAKHVAVVQYPNGTMRVFADPGPQWSWFGTVTRYQRRAQFEFDNDKAACQAGFSGRGTQPLPIKFAEGGNAVICGELSFEMPAKQDQMVEIQKDFGSMSAIEQQLIKPALTNAINLSGQTMRSDESVAERRSELLHFIEDQMKFGVYKTTTRQIRELDKVTKQDRTITVVEIVKDGEGKAVRNNVSAISKYGIDLVQTSISYIKYSNEVEAQINAQQAARARVQVSINEAIAAEQETRTLAEKGKQTATKAEWDQKTLAAKAIEQARQEKVVAETHAAKAKEVAKLEKEAAEFTKQKEILLGQGESERKRLVMSADGALEKKLEAYVSVNAKYADAIQNYAGNWVPTTVMGGAGSGNVNGAQTLIDMLTAKTARELQLDMSVKK